jgi:hypothetical protein
VEPYWTPRNLSLDLLLAAVVLYAAWRILLSVRAQELRLRFGRLAAAGGLIGVALGVAGLAGEWPQAAQAVTRQWGGQTCSSS